MGIQWGTINRNGSRHEVTQQIKQLVRADNYGFGDDEWNLTDTIIESSQLKFNVFQILGGDEPNGKKSKEGPMKGPDGDPFKFRLRVLSRQACHRDKDGNELNGYDRDLNGDEAPEHNDDPKAGDVVRIKGDKIERDPLTGQPTTRAVRTAMIHRGQDLYHYTNRIVDDDGCISCTYAEAHQLLSRNGKNLVHPEFGAFDKAAQRDKRKQRKITNWHFEEVSADYTKTKKRGRPPKKTEGVSPSA